MYKGLKILFTLLLTTMVGGNMSAQTFMEAETIEQAKVKVFPADDMESADLCVYFVYETKDVQQVGYWMEVYEKSEAQVMLIFVDDLAQADFTVWIVDTPQEVGWRNRSKMKLLTVEGLKNAAFLGDN